MATPPSSPVNNNLVQISRTTRSVERETESLFVKVVRQCLLYYFKLVLSHFVPLLSLIMISVV